MLSNIFNAVLLEAFHVKITVIIDTIPNGTIITEFPRLGIIMILKNTLRFYDGE